MSCIAVKITSTSISMAADSIRVSGYTQSKDHSKSKLFQVNDISIGHSGLCSEGGLLYLYCATHKPSGSTELDIVNFFSDFTDWYRKKLGNGGIKLEGEFLIVFQGKVYYIIEFCIREVFNTYAIGAGRDFALAALSLGASPEKAVEVACDLSIYCEQP